MVSDALEGQSVPIDRERARLALPALGPLLARLPEYPAPEDIARELPDTTAELAAQAIDEYDDGNGAINFVQSMLIARQLDSAAAVHEGKLIVETEEAQAAIHHGALTVRGDLDLHANLIVLGDLHVDGRVRDVVTWTRLIVTGNLRCTTIWSGGPIWVAGSVNADVAYLDYHGRLFCGDGLHATLVVASPEARGINGDLHVTHHSSEEEWRTDAAAALARLRQLLLPELMETIDDRYFVPDKLLARAEAGERYLRDDI